MLLRNQNRRPIVFAAENSFPFLSDIVQCNFLFRRGINRDDRDSERVLKSTANNKIPNEWMARKKLKKQQIVDAFASCFYSFGRQKENTHISQLRMIASKIIGYNDGEGEAVLALRSPKRKRNFWMFKSEIRCEFYLFCCCICFDFSSTMFLFWVVCCFCHNVLGGHGHLAKMTIGKGCFIFCMCIFFLFSLVGRFTF